MSPYVSYVYEKILEKSKTLNCLIKKIQRAVHLEMYEMVHFMCDIYFPQF
jgi:hypothetical protein